MPELPQPTLDAELDEHFDSWLFACHACRHEGFSWVFGMYQEWSQDDVHVEMLWHRLTAHYRPDAHRFDGAFTIGFNHTVMPEAKLP
jgi:hypothetical protein